MVQAGGTGRRYREMVFMEHKRRVGMMGNELGKLREEGKRVVGARPRSLG